MCLFFGKRKKRKFTKKIQYTNIALPNANCNVLGKKDNFEISIMSQNAIEYKFKVENNEIVEFWQTGMANSKKYEV